MRAEGWYHDPYGIHDDRWISDGHPTNLVRDKGVESRDAPPPEERRLALVPANPDGGWRSSQPPDSLGD